MSCPKRIVSLVPSQTELLHSLRLQDEVVGITKFCIYPNEWFRTKQRIGGTKTIDIGKIKAIRPDLVIANKEENVKEQIEQLQEFVPVWVSDIATLADALFMIQSVGTLVDRPQQALTLATQISDSFGKLLPVAHSFSTAYLIWKNPYMAVGKPTFIDDIMQRCGFKNLFDQQRYPATTVEELTTLGCELLLLSSEPYPFKQHDLEELQQQLPDTKIVLVDGEYFSWYGSRLSHSPDYLQGLVNELSPGK